MRLSTTRPFTGTVDPLSGQGIHKAINNGLQAGEAVAELMRSNDSAKIDHYNKSLTQNYQNYLERKRDYYSLEKRWPESTFWQRRIGQLISE